MKRFALLLFVAWLAGCDHHEDRPAYPIVMHVQADTGAPVAGAAVLFGGHAVGHTDDAGSVALGIHGGEGDRVGISVSCPDGFRSPAAPTDVVLHRLDKPGRRPEYSVTCHPMKRSLVVVVRADHGPNLPVVYLGREIARTDESGAAHAMVEAAAGDDVEITLSTSEPGSERLRPQNPSMKFIGAETGDLKVYSVKFQVEPEVRRAWHPVARPMPIRIN